MAGLSFDIFCRVVDNFGDIGVCWRLARQLARMPGQRAVRLWVDDLHSFSRIEPRLDPYRDPPPIDGVELVHWTSPAPDLAPHDVAIEAFGCDPPVRFIERMACGDCLWINLEYLSAEPWVESCHAMPSLQANGVRKAFFFPGFTPRTGGLLREPGLLSDRDAWLADPRQRTHLLRKTGLPEPQIALLQKADLPGLKMTPPPNRARQIVLFSYPDAPADSLLDVLSEQAVPTVIMVPAGVCPALARGQQGAAYVHEMPFVAQADFDRLLWSSDLNCIRGEDSLVRAIWAGKPLLWHIYPQDGDAHMKKLAAWLALAPVGPEHAKLMTAWNLGDRHACAALLRQALSPAGWADWQAASTAWAAQQAELPDLAETLIRFCRKMQKS
ncbi:MAG: elongation factor P maturation arginine rhamnosyltransferase EarP [Pusillimonas sp.]